MFKKLLKRIADPGDEEQLEVVGGIWNGHPDPIKEIDRGLKTQSLAEESDPPQVDHKEERLENEKDRFESVLRTEKNDLRTLEDRPKSGRAPAAEGLMRHLQSMGRSQNTLRTYRSELNYWSRAANKRNKSIYKLNYKDIEDVIIGMDGNTARKKISFLRTLSKWFLREGHPFLHGEMAKVKLGKGKMRIPKNKTEHEFRKIRSYAKELVEDQDDRRGIWLGLMMMCGLRISEIQTVEVMNDGIKVRGKGDKERKVPCPAWLMSGLRRIQANGRGGYKQGRQVIHVGLKKLGYSKNHSLRHTYATTLLHRGVALEDIQFLLGHVSIQTTQVYAQTKMPEGINEIMAH